MNGLNAILDTPSPPRPHQHVTLNHLGRCITRRYERRRDLSELDRPHLSAKLSCSVLSVIHAGRGASTGRQWPSGGPPGPSDMKHVLVVADDVAINFAFTRKVSEHLELFACRLFMD